MKKKNKISSLNNIDVINNRYILIKINPKIYPLSIVQSAAYVLMDRAFAIIDGDPDKGLLIELKPRNKKENLEELGRDFNNELINYSVYNIQSKRTMPLREKIIQRALFTNLSVKPVIEKENKIVNIPQRDESVLSTCECESENDIISNESNTEADYLNDPEGINQSWSEKYGNESAKEEIQTANTKETIQDLSNIYEVQQKSYEGILKENDPNSEADYLNDPEGITQSWSERNKAEKNIQNNICKPEQTSTDPNSISSDESYLDDPEGLAIPWHEKYLKENKKNDNCHK